MTMRSSSHWLLAGIVCAFAGAERLQASWTARVLALCVGVLLSLVAGFRSTPTGFRWFAAEAAFQGGEKFLLLQLLGWLIIGAVGGLSVHQLWVPHGSVGWVGVGLGWGAFFGSGLLLTSTTFFVEGATPAQRRLVRGSRSAILLSVLSAGLYFGSDATRGDDATGSAPSSALSSRLLWAGCAAMVASALRTHTAAAALLPGYQLVRCPQHQRCRPPASLPVALPPDTASTGRLRPVTATAARRSSRLPEGASLWCCRASGGCSSPSRCTSPSRTPRSSCPTDEPCLPLSGSSRQRLSAPKAPPHTPTPPHPHRDLVG